MELARDGKLSYTARSVALYVWSHDERWQQSAAAVAEDLGMNRGTVGKALVELEERGWLVREIHQIIGESGKLRTAWERWHLQMTNRRFTPDEVQELREAGDVLMKPARSKQTCLRGQHLSAGETSTPRAGQTSTIEMEPRNAPEVHSSNASADQDETGHGGRSLAVADPEATAEDRPATSRQAGPDAEPASADVLETSEEANRPVGLQPLARSSMTDPFASEPAWRAEAAAREKRVTRLLEPATASHRVPDPWSS
ncbi:helix-turn-helix domain-containing protein [Rhodococcus sp. C26F]